MAALCESHLVATDTVTANTPERVEVTILMPCLNEEKTLSECILAAYSSLQRLSVVGEVLIADNGSTDGSVEIAHSNGARVVGVKKRGYGAALIKGIESARGKYVIMGDADCSYDFSAIDEFLGKLREGADLVCGNRFKGGIESGAMPVLHKYLGNPVLSFLGRLFYRIEIGDFHCGIRGVNKESILKLGLSCPGMEFASEMIVKAAKHKLDICEVPTTLRVDKRDRSPHLRTWRDGWRHLKFLLMLAPKVAFLGPSAISILLGLVITLNVLFGTGIFFSSSGLVPGVHSLLYASAMIVVGIELLFMYFLFSTLSEASGLLSVDSKWRRLRLVDRLDWVIGLGTVITSIGVGLAIKPLGFWASVDFGALDPSDIMRQAIPAVTMVVVGVLVVANSILLSAVDYLIQDRRVL
ncbi:Glycosyltransferase involved in cell wall bisynthesis [Microbulbifer donghaiensis]|uniref:Glycosyltransferase involved in cell wall bisynthesis n=1 Tax=Microbulbifer donghaiensis TaxID=494016 RepID=A0A1M4XR24_9GAMM|nr:glycosyltransferase family 2 protein [Microbulbifer donghaiensis]SHE95898.1 Glycosyltransferase involved in cell wall bisynthesis [Microbulbifer donghaiensis]